MANPVRSQPATQEPAQAQEWDSPPLTLGPKRVHYQFSNILPQAHLTFVSIVQGIAFGILLQNVPIPNRTDAIDLITFFLAQHAYLPWIISGSLVVIIWKQFVQASLFVVWPLSFGQISLMLVIAAAESFAFREIQHLNGWIVGIGCVAFIGGMIRLNNLNLRKPADYEAVGQYQEDNRSELLFGILYSVLGILVGVSGLLLHYAAALAQNAVPRTWIALVILAAITIVVIWLDARDFKQGIIELVNGSGLEYAAPGFVRYRTNVAKKINADI